MSICWPKLVDIWRVAVDSICYKFIIVDCNILGHLSDVYLTIRVIMTAKRISKLKFKILGSSRNIMHFAKCIMFV